jgi:hypothetical protein
LQDIVFEIVVNGINFAVAQHRKMEKGEKLSNIFCCSNVFWRLNFFLFEKISSFLGFKSTLTKLEQVLEQSYGTTELFQKKIKVRFGKKNINRCSGC